MASYKKRRAWWRMDFWEFWFGSWRRLPGWFRVGSSVALILSSFLLGFLRGTFWPWGWITGTVLLMISLPSDRERKGYHD